MDRLMFVQSESSELAHWSLFLQVMVSFQDIAFPDGATAEHSTSHILHNLSRWSKSSMAASFPMQVPHFHVVFLDNSVCHMLILHQTQIHNWESCSFAQFSIPFTLFKALIILNKVLAAGENGFFFKFCNISEDRSIKPFWDCWLHLKMAVML